VVLLGALCLWQASVIPATPLYAQVGPKFVPYLVGGLVVIIGAGLTISALRGGWSAQMEEVRDAPPTNWRALALVGAGLVANLDPDRTGWASSSPRRCSLCWWPRPSAVAGHGAGPADRAGRDPAVPSWPSMQLLGVNIGAGCWKGLL
jgi:hypothetical protein